MSQLLHRIIPLGLLTIVTLVSLCDRAAAFGPCCCFCQAGRCQVEVEKEEVEKKEFVCECEAVCIPPLRFPWECGPLTKCGKVRMIKKLGSEKSTEFVCVYNWTAIRCCPSCAHKVRCSRPCGSSVVCPPCDPPSAALPTPLLPTPCADSALSTEDAGEAADFAARYPEVSVAMIGAIRSAKPDRDGWITLSNPAADSLSAERQLIETAVEN